jgi:hypothetical protein
VWPQSHRDGETRKQGEGRRFSLSPPLLVPPSLWLCGSVAKPKSISIEIEDVIEPAFAFAFVVIGVFPMFAVMLVIIVVIAVLPVVGDPGGTFDEFVQLAAVEPYAAALRAIINLHALSFVQQKFYLTNRTYHLPFSLIALWFLRWSGFIRTTNPMGSDAMLQAETEMFQPVLQFCPVSLERIAIA